MVEVVDKRNKEVPQEEKDRYNKLLKVTEEYARSIGGLFVRASLDNILIGDSPVIHVRPGTNSADIFFIENEGVAYELLEKFEALPEEDGWTLNTY